jgi:hypothetical protein
VPEIRSRFWQMDVSPVPRPEVICPQPRRATRPPFAVETTPRLNRLVFLMCSFLYCNGPGMICQCFSARYSINCQMCILICTQLYHDFVKLDHDRVVEIGMLFGFVAQFLNIYAVSDVYR